jgi:hypothetical protein
MSPGSEEVAAEALGANSSPLLRHIAITAAIASRGNANLGCASTAAYSSSNSSEKQECSKPLMNGEQDQRLVTCGREESGNQHIGVDNRPDHDAPPGAGSFLRR